MKKELKGLDGKVAIHCTTPVELKMIGSMLGIAEWEINWAIKEIEQGKGVAFDKDNSGRLDYYQEVKYTIIPASLFIALNTDQPDKEPAWTFKTDEELKKFISAFASSKSLTISEYIRSIRTPAFSLQCRDGVVTDPDAFVWVINYGEQPREVQSEKALKMGFTCFTTEQAALTHRLHNTEAIKLSDMEINLGARGEYYWILKEDAENLVNERIDGK
jgi:hypothetical protein